MEGGSRRDRLHGSVQIPTVSESADGPVLDHTTYQFYISTSPQMAVVQTGQKAPYAVLRSALEGAAAVEEYGADKRGMARLADAIREHGGNIIHDPHFEFEGGAGYDGLSRSGFTLTRSRCATTRLEYAEMLKRASVFEPIVRVFQADGICEDRHETGRLLRINRNFGFSMYLDVPLEMWAVFMKKCVHPALNGGR